MFDFCAFKKAQATIHAIGHACVEQGGFDHTALRVAAIQHCDFMAMRHTLAAVAVLALAQQVLHFFDHPLRFGKVGGRFIHPHRFTLALGGVQVFAQTVFVVANQMVGAVQNIAEAAVVLLELDLVLHRILAHKVSHIAHARTSKSVNALVVVAHRKNSTTALMQGPGQLLDPRVLQFVGVLKLVNQNVFEATTVMFAHRVVVAQQFVRAQHEFTKVHHAFALALGFVQLIQLYFFAGLGVAHHHISRAQTIFFATGNEPHGLLRRKTLFIDLKLFAQTFDGTQLVLGVQNLKGLRQVGQLPVRA